MTDLVLRAERILIDGTLRAAAIAIADGQIADIGAFDADYPVAEAWMPPNAVLLPGFVDTHVQLRRSPGSCCSSASRRHCPPLPGDTRRGVPG